MQLTFENFLPITVEGLDINLDYRLRDTPLGSFSVSVNAAKLIRYYMAPGPVGEELAEGQAAGEINAGVPLTAGGDFVAKNGRPKWRYSVNATWSAGPYRVGAFVKYTDAVDIIDVIDAQTHPWVLKSQTTVNLYGQYQFEGDDTIFSRSQIQLGVRNLFDKDPPLHPSNGYLASLYQPQARYWYASLKKAF
jgi:outer membrane receptor protein involved in Fe transport